MKIELKNFAASGHLRCSVQQRAAAVAVLHHIIYMSLIPNKSMYNLRS